MENKAPSVGMSTNPVGASPDAVVVVPTYNEADNIARLAELIRDVGCSLLVVDDGSPDGTGALVDELAAHDDGISVMHRAHKAGIGPAYSAGFAHVPETSAQIICQIDADFSHDPHDLPRLIDSVKAGADLAIGSRYVVGGDTPDWPVIRRLISRAETSMPEPCSESAHGTSPADSVRGVGSGWQPPNLPRRRHRGTRFRWRPPGGQCEPDAPWSSTRSYSGIGWRVTPRWARPSCSRRPDWSPSGDFGASPASYPDRNGYRDHRPARRV